MILHVVGPYAGWYEVANPQEIRSRVELFNSFPLQMLVQARRKKIVPLFTRTPQQSDYTPRWSKPSSVSVTAAPPAVPALARITPGLARLKNVLKSGWHFFHNNSLRNRRYFRPVTKRWL
jgi:hypothetical protein